MRITVRVPVDCVITDEEAEKKFDELVKKHGMEKILSHLGDMLSYEIIRAIGDVYDEAIELTIADIDALEEVME